MDTTAPAGDTAAETAAEALPAVAVLPAAAVQAEDTKFFNQQFLVHGKELGTPKGFRVLCFFKKVNHCFSETFEPAQAESVFKCSISI